jgi:uncharacterized protein YjiS (DUF1127 family)
MTTLSMNSSRLRGRTGHATKTWSSPMVPRWWHALATRLARRRTLRKFYHLSPHLLRDMGFDPAEVYGAFEGTLAEVHGDRWRGLTGWTHGALVHQLSSPTETSGAPCAARAERYCSNRPA